MSYTKILIHAVWATKDRKPLMNKTNRHSMWNHIRENCSKKNIYLINLNGWEEHAHCFFSMAPDQNVSNIMNLIKGESSHWANRNLKWSEKFGWQDEYYAVSVSPSNFNKVNNYISNQEVHHRTKTFQEEYDFFILNYKNEFGI